MLLKTKCALPFLLLTLLVSPDVPAGWDPTRDAAKPQAQEPEQERTAEETIRLFRQKDAKMKVFFDKAHGYAVFPTVGKAGMGFGGAHGKGKVFEKGRLIGTTSLTQVTFGLQFGAQVYSEIIFFKDKAALDDFTGGNFELGAQASAVAATAGAAANAEYSDGVAIFTMSRGGLMYEASVGGQKFNYKPIK